MKKPKNLSAISLNDISIGPYPPRSFLAFYEAELGNGDYFGLYWPIGLESKEPIICDMIHDEWRLVPTHSNLDKFIEWYELNNKERGDHEILDPNLCSSKYINAREALKNKSFQDAITYLAEACNLFPEISEYWQILSSLYFKEGDTASAFHAAIQSYCSNWSFGIPSSHTLQLLTQAANYQRLQETL